MARGKSRGQRDNNSQSLATEGLLSDIQDSRRFTFEEPRAPLSVSGNVVRVKDRHTDRIQPFHVVRTLMEYPQKQVGKVKGAVRSNYYRSLTPSGRRALARTQMAFEAPKRVVHCVRRKVRKEVLFAFKRTRKGAGAGRRHRNEWSNIQC